MICVDKYPDSNIMTDIVIVVWDIWLLPCLYWQANIFDQKNIRKIANWIKNVLNIGHWALVTEHVIKHITKDESVIWSLK